MSSYEAIRFEVEQGVASIILNRPEAANAFTARMVTEIRDAVLRCELDAKVRVVVLSGAASDKRRFFSAGGDLGEFARADNPARLLYDMTLALHDAVVHLQRMDAPVIASVSGIAAGGGLSLCLGADLIWAAESAKFTMGYPKVGLSPDGTSTYFLPRVVGLRRAQELLLTDRVLNAQEAKSWGLVTNVVADDALETAVRELANQLAHGPKKAFGETKRLLASSFQLPLSAQADLESEAIARLAASAEGQEGISAFLEKRKPRFGEEPT